VRDGFVPEPIPTPTRINLIQVVDTHGRVVKASASASASVPLSHVRPPPQDRFKSFTQCWPDGRCALLMAIRATPAQNSSFVYAGLLEPPVLSSHWLEIGITACSLPILGLVTWMTWSLVGRTLRPVETIRSLMSEISESDLSLRVPLPPGHDEIVMLAQTANQTLARLEAAVKQQRRFASDAAHELRRPIAGLRAALEEAQLYPDEVDPHEAIRSALTTADRLQAIISDLLALARLRAGDPPQPEHIDLATLVAEVAAARPAGPPVCVDATARVRVRGSRIQLLRLVDNLLANAQRHAATQVQVTVDIVDSQAVLTVCDDGAGVAPKDRERIFTRFVRLDDARRREPGGTGLGLAISREIAEAHGGTLKVEDSPQGARFALRLPLGASV
jgi:signal transduction histidine kinase